MTTLYQYDDLPAFWQRKLYAHMARSLTFIVNFYVKGLVPLRRNY